jgi:hypothetical protein
MMTMTLKELFPIVKVPRKPSREWWSQRLSAQSSFCRAVMGCGILTHRQMVHAALRYRLGRSKDDAVIYWQIDLLGTTHDGKLMWYGPDCHRLKNRNATWVMFLMKKHSGIPQNTFQPHHVFFGLHLLRHVKPQDSCQVCIVEAEKTAVIMSELCPQHVWLAAGGLYELQDEKFFALRHYRVVLFPDTDPDMRAYTLWYETAQRLSASFLWPKDNPIHVSDFLERNATPEQKSRKIDIVDYLLER